MPICVPDGVKSAVTLLPNRASESRQGPQAKSCRLLFHIFSFSRSFTSFSLFVLRHYRHGRIKKTLFKCPEIKAKVFLHVMFPGSTSVRYRYCVVYSIVRLIFRAKMFKYQINKKTVWMLVTWSYRSICLNPRGGSSFWGLSGWRWRYADDIIHKNAERKTCWIHKINLHAMQFFILEEWNGLRVTAMFPFWHVIIKCYHMLLDFWTCVPCFMFYTQTRLHHKVYTTLILLVLSLSLCLRLSVRLHSSLNQSTHLWLVCRPPQYLSPLFLFSRVGSVNVLSFVFLCPSFLCVD